MTNARITRRHFIAGTLAVASTLRLQRAGRAMGLPRAADVCRLAAEQEVGPFYLADELLRADVSEGKAGVPLDPRIVVLDARTCVPLPDAAATVCRTARPDSSRPTS